MSTLAIPCNPSNYGGLRGSRVQYIVVHYTAGKGDTAKANGQYFASNERLYASAHWFVDETDRLMSVPENFVAYHCGGVVYSHPQCRNGSSIGVELCSEWDAERGYYFNDATIANAQGLIRELMAKYSIPVDRVIRHYDVTGKCCPAPFVGEHKDAWEEFLGGLTMYAKFENVPDWAKATVQKLMDKDILLGDGNGNLNLSGDMVRLLVLLDRAGIWKEETI